MMKTVVAFGVTLLLSLQWAFGQESPAGQGAAFQAQERLRIASTSMEYPVTPGDEYRLTYRQGDTLASLAAVVDVDSRIQLGLFGAVDASGMTFSELKEAVEKQILGGYPRSTPSLTLAAVSVFRVFVRGEVAQASYVTAWGLNHVSDVLQGISAPSASLRNVQVVSHGGTVRTCDLYAGLHRGAAAENPYVRPGDTIVLAPSERRVQIAGDVREPGTYDLLPEEQLLVLVDVYGGGLRSRADASRVAIRRAAGKRATQEYVDLTADSARAVALADGDVVTVSANDARLPAVYFEGAIQVPAQAPTAAATAATPATSYGRTLYSFRDGETLSDALASVRPLLSPLADLAQATVIREGRADPIPVDLRALLAQAGTPADIPLAANDRIVIPLLDYTVSVFGDVATPGSYPYAAAHAAWYYVSLAGTNAQDAGLSMTVTDRDGNQRDPAADIQPEDRISVVGGRITVQGAVFTPGLFSFLPGAPASHYITLAGGPDPERNMWGVISIYDSTGKKKGRDVPLSSGDRIYVPNNDVWYTISRYAPIFTAVVTAVAAGLGIYFQYIAPAQ
jgi:polysaccharide export outer membrane protein